VSVGPGFFGKLRSHGDFVTRRLPPAFVQPFDAWLQAGLVHSRADLGARWLPLYLNSPLWRFVLAPGVCGPQAWAGVMMPSVDRVGRCFPLTLAAGIDGAPSLPDCRRLHAGWFGHLEALALSALDAGFDVDRFDAALQALGGAPPAHPGIDARSAWWTDGAQPVAPDSGVGPALPPAASFAALLDGRWQAHGWEGVSAR
jgi:type VI secretion system protein ImpM